MNERIRELVKQAGVNLSSFQFSGTPTKYEVAESELEKFAELIVRECAELAREWEDDYVVEDTAPFHSDVKIKKHFGVE